MLLKIETHDPITMVQFICDELDAENSESFARELEPYLRAGAQMIFDMKDLKFIDSSGLGALLTCKRKLQECGGVMKLCGLSKTVREILELVRLVRVFEIYDTPESAAQSFHQS